MGRLVTPQEVRDYSGHRSEDDALVERMIKGLEQVTEKYARRRFSPDPVLADGGADTNPPVTKTLRYFGNPQIMVPDLRVITSLSLGGSLLGSTDYTLWPGDNGAPARDLELGPYVVPVGVSGPGANAIAITGRWGFAQTPDDIKHFVSSIVARSFKKREANFADLVQQGPEGAIYRYIKSLPEELRMIINNYKRVRVAIV